jgi:trigger factor
MARRFNTGGESLARMLEASGKDQEALFVQWRPAVEKALQSRLVVETLIRDLAFEVGDEEVEKEMETLAAESGSSLEELKKYYAEENPREYLKEEIKERKLYDLLLEENRVKKGPKGSYLDLVSNNG